MNLRKMRQQVRRLQTDWIRGDGTYDGMVKAKILRAFLVNPDDIAIDRTGLR